MARSRRQEGLGSAETASPVAEAPLGTPGASGVGEPEGTVRADLHKIEARVKRPTVWRRVIPAVVFLVIMLIFILQNYHGVQVSFITLHGRFPLALCLLFAGILGALVVAFLEMGRAMQIRRTKRRKPPF